MSINYLVSGVRINELSVDADDALSGFESRHVRNAKLVHRPNEMSLSTLRVQIKSKLIGRILLDLKTKKTIIMYFCLRLPKCKDAAGAACVVERPVALHSLFDDVERWPTIPPDENDAAVAADVG